MSYINTLSKLLGFIYLFQISIYAIAENDYNNSDSIDVAICFSNHPYFFPLTGGKQTNPNILSSDSNNLDSIIIEIVKTKRPLVYFANDKMIEHGINDSLGKYISSNTSGSRDKSIINLVFEKISKRKIDWLNNNGIKFPIIDTLLLENPKNNSKSSLFSFELNSFTIDSTSYYFTYNSNDSLLVFRSSDGDKLLHSWELKKTTKPKGLLHPKEYICVENELLFSMFNLDYFQLEGITDIDSLIYFVTALGINSRWPFFKSIVSISDRNNKDHHDLQLRNIKIKYLPSIILRLYFLENKDQKLFYNPFKHIVELKEKKLGAKKVTYWTVKKKPNVAIINYKETLLWLKAHIYFSIVLILFSIIFLPLIVRWIKNRKKPHTSSKKINCDKNKGLPICSLKQLIAVLTEYSSNKEFSELLLFLENNQEEKDKVVKGMLTLLPFITLAIDSGSKNEKLLDFIKTFKKRHKIDGKTIDSQKEKINNKNAESYPKDKKEKDYNLFYIIFIEYMALGDINKAKKTLLYFNGMDSTNSDKEWNLIQPQKVDIDRPEKCLTDMLLIIENLENLNKEAKGLNKIKIENLSDELWNDNITIGSPQDTRKQKKRTISFRNKLSLLRQRNDDKTIKQIINYINNTAQTKNPNTEYYEELNEIQKKIKSFDKINTGYHNLVDSICNLKDDDSNNYNTEKLLTTLNTWTKELKLNEEKDVRFEELKAFLLKYKPNPIKGLVAELNKLILLNKDKGEPPLDFIKNILFFALGKLGVEDINQEVYEVIAQLGENLKTLEIYKNLLRSNDIYSLLEHLIGLKYENELKVVELNNVWEKRNLINDHERLIETITKLRIEDYGIIEKILFKISKNIKDQKTKSKVEIQIKKLIKKISNTSELIKEISELEKHKEKTEKILYEVRKDLNEWTNGAKANIDVNIKLRNNIIIPDEIDEEINVKEIQYLNELSLIKKLLERDRMQTETFAAMKALISRDKTNNKSIHLSWEKHFKQVLFNHRRYYVFFKGVINSPFLALMKASKKNDKFVKLPIEYKKNLLKSLFEMALLVKDEAIKSRYYRDEMSFGEVTEFIADNNIVYMSHLYKKNGSPEAIINQINKDISQEIKKIKEFNEDDDTTDMLMINLLVIAKEIGIERIDTLVNGYYLPKPLKEYNP